MLETAKTFARMVGRARMSLSGCETPTLIFHTRVGWDLMTITRWKIERRESGVLVVRIPSEPRNGEVLPDAAFSFRAGDPQYQLWEQRWREQETLKGTASVNGTPISGTQQPVTGG